MQTQEPQMKNFSLLLCLNFFVILYSLLRGIIIFITKSLKSNTIKRSWVGTANVCKVCVCVYLCDSQHEISILKYLVKCFLSVKNKFLLQFMRSFAIVTESQVDSCPKSAIQSYIVEIHSVHVFN